MDIIDLKEATHMRDLFAAFVTQKQLAKEILELIEKHPFEYHGSGISEKLGYKLGAIQHTLNRLVKGGLIEVKPGTGKQHLATYYAAVPEKVEELKATYKRFSR